MELQHLTNGGTSPISNHDTSTFPAASTPNRDINEEHTNSTQTAKRPNSAEDGTHMNSKSGPDSCNEEVCKSHSELKEKVVKENGECSEQVSEMQSEEVIEKVMPENGNSQTKIGTTESQNEKLEKGDDRNSTASRNEKLEIEFERNPTKSQNEKLEKDDDRFPSKSRNVKTGSEDVKMERSESGSVAEKATDVEKGEGKKWWRRGKETKKTKKTEMEIPDDGVPYDRGWAWMICLSGFVNFVIAAGYNRATFIFFVNFLDEFRAPVSETALLFGVKAGVNSIVGLFVMNAVLGRFGVRKTVLVGGLCLALSAILGSFANDVTSLILSQAIFHGLGMSMLNMPTTVLLGYYFRRRRSLANSIMKCGVGVGAVIFPPFVTFFLSEYGLRGSLLLCGGICLNTLVAAMLLRPVSMYKKDKLSAKSKPVGGEGNTEKLTEGKKEKEQIYQDENSEKTNNTSKPMSEEKEDEQQILLENCDYDVLPRRVCRCRHHSAEIYNQSRNLAGECRVSISSPGDPARRDEICITPEADDCLKPKVDNSQNSERTTLPSQSLPEWNCTNSVQQQHKSVPSHADKAKTPMERKINGNVQQNGVDGAKSLLSSPNVTLVVDVSYLSKSTPELYREAGFVRPRTYTFHDVIQPRSPKQSVLDAVSQSSLVKHLSNLHLEPDSPCLPPPPRDSEPANGSDRNKRTCCGHALSVLRRVFSVLDFSLFRSPMFRLLVVFFITSPLIHSVPTYLPAMAKERGLDDDQRALLLSIIGGMDFFCRLGSGLLADLKIMKVSTMIGVSSVILGVVCQLTRLLSTFPLLVGFVAVQGMLGGVAACMLPILIMEDIGLEHTAKALGFFKLFAGASMAAFHPLLGYIRDATGSYDAAYHVIGALTLVSAVAIMGLRYLPHTLKEHEQQDEAQEKVPLNNQKEPL